jgi:hypothetical protein
MRDYERRISFYNRYFVFMKVRSIDNAELVVKSLLGTSTAFEKQMAALEQEQAELDEAPLGAPVVPLTNPKPKPKAAKTATAKPATAKPATATTAVPDAVVPVPVPGPEPEKKKPGRKPKIQLVVKE